MIRIELVIAVLLSAFIILNGYFQTNLTNAYIYKLVARFFGYSPLMGPFIAVFAAYLWGTDYEYGTLRNKPVAINAADSPFYAGFDAGAAEATDLITGEKIALNGGFEIPGYRAFFLRV